jgi:hypothetical protein
MRVQTGTILFTCWLVLIGVEPAEAQTRPSPPLEALRFFKTMTSGNNDTEILRRLRPAPASEPERIRALAEVAPESVLLPDASERRKLDTLEAVLIYHERQHVIEIKLIDVPMAVVGLHGRAVILISRPALRLLSVPELQGTVAHEIGHEYFWGDDYAALRARNDIDALQVLELKCDGVAVLTLVALGLDPANLSRAIEKIGRFNEVPNTRWRNNSYPHPQDRERFIRALLDMMRSTATREVTQAAPLLRCCRGNRDDRTVHRRLLHLDLPAGSAIIGVALPVCIPSALNLVSSRRRAH